jgi:hypothetical protein
VLFWTTFGWVTADARKISATHFPHRNINANLEAIPIDGWYLVAQGLNQT